MSKINYLVSLILVTSFIAGCANMVNQNALNESNNALRSGDVPTALSILEEANKNKKEKDTPYYLDKGEITKYLGVQNLSSIFQRCYISISL